MSKLNKKKGVDDDNFCRGKLMKEISTIEKHIPWE